MVGLIKRVWNELSDLLRESRVLEPARPREDWYSEFAEGLEAFARDLPADIAFRFKRSKRRVSLEIPPLTPCHRRIVVEGCPSNFEYEVGKIWGEVLEPTADGAREMLAVLDALKFGRAREVTDLRTGLLYQVFRLRTRGFNRFNRDSQYSLWHYLRQPVRQVKIARIPPLASAAR